MRKYLGYIARVAARLYNEDIYTGARLGETDLMQLVIYPLTYRGRKHQSEAVGRAVALAKQIKDDRISVFATSAILVFADKVISDKDAEYFRRMIGMDKVSKLIFNEGWDAGMAQGIEQGISQGLSQGISQGVEQGRNDSITKLAHHYMNGDPSLTEKEAMEMAKSILR